MWLFTQHGFYSIVAQRQQPGHFLVRARVRQDLANLATAAGLTQAIATTRDADYPYRFSVNASELGAVMAAQANAIDYVNFKGRIAQLPGQRARLGVYHEVWAQVATLQE